MMMKSAVLILLVLVVLGGGGGSSSGGLVDDSSRSMSMLLVMMTTVDAFSLSSVLPTVQDAGTSFPRDPMEVPDVRRKRRRRRSSLSPSLSSSSSSSLSSSILWLSSSSSSSSSSGGNEEYKATSTVTMNDDDDDDTTDRLSLLPSLESLRNDPFMKQVQHGHILTVELKKSYSWKKQVPSAAVATTGTEESTNDKYHDLLRRALGVQLSHSDGVRGFMVSYLTYEDEDEADSKSSSSSSSSSGFVVPEELLQSVIVDRLRQNKDDGGADDDLVGLMCMNVVMPTAMVTMHTDRELSNSSARTAQRGIGLLRTVLEQERKSGEDDWSVETNLVAILHAAADTSDRDSTIAEGGGEAKDLQPSSEEVGYDKLVNYWKKFFENYGYQKEQLDGIANAAKQILTIE